MALCAWTGDDKFSCAGGLVAWLWALEANEDLVSLLRANGIHALDGEGRVVHLARKGCGLHKDILEGDGDVGASTDGHGALGFGRCACTIQREYIISSSAG